MMVKQRDTANLIIGIVGATAFDRVFSETELWLSLGWIGVLAFSISLFFLINNGKQRED